MANNNSIVDYERIYENFSIRDPNSPYSLINIAPGNLRDQLLTVPEDLLGLSERELNNLVKPDVELKKLRTSFWLEYVRAIKTNTKMLPQNIYAGVCLARVFNKIILNNRYLVYICTPRPDYNVELEDLLFLGLERERDILEADPFEIIKRKNPDTGQLYEVKTPNVKLMALQRAVFNDISIRRRGTITQQLDINQKSVNLNFEAPAQALPTNVNEINQQLAQLQALESSSSPITIEVPREKEAIPTEAKEEDSDPMP